MVTSNMHKLPAGSAKKVNRLHPKNDLLTKKHPSNGYINIQKRWNFLNSTPPYSLAIKWVS